MNNSETEKSMTPAGEWLALFSRLTGPGIAGLNQALPQQRSKDNFLEQDHTSARNKKSRVIKICRNRQTCLQHGECKPAYKESQTSVDLWFYLSPQSN